MLMNLFKQRSILIGLLLLTSFIPVANAQDEEDLCASAGEEIEYGDTVEGTIDDDLFASFYCFDGDEDDVITVTVTTTDGDLIASVFVTDPFVADIFADDTARNERSDAELTLTLPDDGQYLIIVTREDVDEGDTEGDFEMTLSSENGNGSGNGSGRTSGSSSGGGGNNVDVETSCDEEPLATLSQYQYGIPGSNPDEPLLSYNIGCTGFLVATVVGRSEVVEYEIDRRGNMSFQIGDTTYESQDVSEDEWVIDVSNGGELVLERLEDDGCDDQPLADLNRGAWVIENNVFDFTCNGVVLLSLDGDDVVASSYEIDRDDIVVTVGEDELVFENFEVDDEIMNAEFDGDDVELENVLN